MPDTSNRNALLEEINHIKTELAQTNLELYRLEEAYEECPTLLSHHTRYQELTKQQKRLEWELAWDEEIQYNISPHDPDPSDIRDWPTIHGALTRHTRRISIHPNEKGDENEKIHYFAEKHQKIGDRRIQVITEWELNSMSFLCHFIPRSELEKLIPHTE